MPNKIKRIILQLTENYHLPKKGGCSCGCNTCHLSKPNSIKEILKPLVKKILESDTTSTIINIEGILIVNPTERAQKDILSDIRSINGITIVRSKDIESDSILAINPGQYRTKLLIKIDPHPFIGNGGFTKETLKNIIDEIKKVNGVKGFKLTAKPKKS